MSFLSIIYINITLIITKKLCVFDLESLKLSHSRSDTHNFCVIDQYYIDVND